MNCLWYFLIMRRGLSFKIAHLIHVFNWLNVINSVKSFGPAQTVEKVQVPISFPDPGSREGINNKDNLVTFNSDMACHFYS